MPQASADRKSWRARSSRPRATMVSGSRGEGGRSLQHPGGVGVEGRVGGLPGPGHIGDAEAGEQAGLVGALAQLGLEPGHQGAGVAGGDRPRRAGRAVVAGDQEPAGQQPGRKGHGEHGGQATGGPGPRVRGAGWGGREGARGGPEAPSSGSLRSRGAATDVVRVAGVPLVGGTHVRELVEERRVVGVHAVAQLVVGRDVEVGRERGAPGQRAARCPACRRRAGDRSGTGRCRRPGAPAGWGSCWARCPC